MQERRITPRRVFMPLLPSSVAWQEGYASFSGFAMLKCP
jgi:hypothetical protein